MKIVSAILITLLFTITANAHNPGGTAHHTDFPTNTYSVKNYTCDQLNSFLENEVVMRVQYQFLSSATGLHVDERQDCGQCYKAVSANVKANSGWCSLGYKCREIKKYKKTKYGKNHKEKRLGKMCRRAFDKGLLK